MLSNSIKQSVVMKNVSKIKFGWSVELLKHSLSLVNKLVVCAWQAFGYWNGSNALPFRSKILDKISESELNLSFIRHSLESNVIVVGTDENFNRKL